MAIVIKEIDVRTTIEQDRAKDIAEIEAMKRRIQEEIQQDIEQQIKADMDRLPSERSER